MKMNLIKGSIKKLLKIKKYLTDNHEYLIENFLIEQEKKMKSGQKILDAGAGQCQYKHIFEKRHKYIAQDLCVGDEKWDFSKIDIKSPVDNIPLPSNSFDYILLTQVLEHVENPGKTIKEMARLLKKDGEILFSAPQCAGEHQIPYHFYNYTKYGLNYLAKQAGLRIIYIKPMGGYFAYIGQSLQFAPYYLFGENAFTKLIFYPYRAIVCSTFLLLDKFSKERNTTSGYIAIFKKGEPKKDNTNMKLIHSLRES